MSGEETPDGLENSAQAEAPLEPGVERQFNEPRRGIWTSGGPAGQENPEADILGEVLHEDQQVYYHMRAPDGHEYWAPSNEVALTPGVTHIEVKEEAAAPEGAAEAVPQAAPEASQTPPNEDSQPEQPAGASVAEAQEANDSPAAESDAKTEVVPASLQTAREKLARAEANLSDIEERLAALKEKAKAAIDDNNFDKAASLSEEAANLKRRSKGAGRRVRSLSREEAMLTDLLDPSALQEIESRVAEELGAEKSRRVRLQDMEPTDSYEEMLMRYHISKYLEKAAQKYPRLPSDLAQEVAQLIKDSKQQSPSYTLLGDHRSSALMEEEAEASSESIAENDNIDAVTPVPDSEKRFSEDDVFIKPGEKSAALKVKGYGRRKGSGEIVVNLVSDDGRTKVWIDQDKVEDMFDGAKDQGNFDWGDEEEQPKVEEAQPAPEAVQSPALGPESNTLESTEPESVDSSTQLEEAPQVRSWNELFGGSRLVEAIESRWGSRNRAVRGLGGRAVRRIVRRKSSDSKTPPENQG
ncbi:MAG TPA: hypothetical protein VFK97_00990 [Candidatus Saccharimonadales bacterium]|nr:hypothetical protein [Candidatus Saccharimonadales bacterium]